MPPEETEATEAETTEAPEVDERPAWYAAEQAALQESLDKRFSVLADMVKATKKKETKDAPKAEITEEQLEAAASFGALRAGLPEAIRAKVDAFREAHGYAGAVTFASSLAEALAEARSDEAPIAPTKGAPKGKGASAAPAKTAHYPTTQAEFYRMVRNDRDLQAALLADPMFRFDALPRY